VYCHHFVLNLVSVFVFRSFCPGDFIENGSSDFDILFGLCLTASHPDIFN
jgi:hypothetical protein